MATKLLSLFAKIGIDDKEYNKGIDNAEEKASKAGNAIRAGFKVAAAGISAAAGAVVAIGKKALDSYAEYEQLAGGAKLMFGDAYDYIAEKAQNAYMTVQMSQNEYLQQVNGFATGLKTALGGNEQAAAELADKIVNAEADVVAATGNTQENVQNAFNGIMKSNYTMLDNLQIGITPTKAGMQEVIDKVNEWNAAQGNLTNYTIDNLADQQAALVDYISMVGMSGYAHDEAMKTIQGSLAATKSAWQNVLTAMADDTQDFGGAVDGLVTSAVALIKNVVPRISSVFTGISKLIAELGEKVLPQIVDQLPVILDSLIPAAISMVESLFTSIAEIIPQLIPILLDALPQILQAGISIILALVTGITENVDTLIPAVVSVVTQIVDQLPVIFDTLIPAAISMVENLFTSIADIIPQLMPILLNSLPLILQAGLSIILALVQGITENVDELIPAIVTVVTELVTMLTDPEMLTQLITAALELMLALQMGIIEAIPQLVDVIPTVIDNIVTALLKLAPELFKVAVLSLVSFISGVSSMNTAIGKAYNTINENIKKKFVELKDKAKQWGKDMLQNFIDGIKEKIRRLSDTITGVADSIKAKLHFSVPDEGPLADADKWMPDFMDLLASGIDTNKFKVTNAIDNLAGDMVLGGDYGDSYETVNETQQFEFTFAEGSASLLQIARLLFPYMQIVQKEKGAV